ncbi:hypothetical protein EYC58_02495 [Candidatus Saccharibacteria bacterium]|nr:MAG: hypothetical protein EYC58_02495 [Candidatus Saccharibacteria bacterium]
MNITIWKKNIREIVQDIASRESQERAWFGKSEQISSPDELYNSLFDDFLFDAFLASSEVNLSSLQKELGMRLSSSLKEYSPQGQELPSPRKMVRDPSWQKVRDIARAFERSLDH